ncbi:hypothetical protein ACFU53_33375 [Streptomyces sp. NPDC057474]|uniref:hypothetical protein n=1 Tax=Streptomyces sp. NPDC057474 TaxID=3346144 RepID=UPI00368BA81C
MKNRLTAALATTGIATSLLVALPAAGTASAAPLICEPGSRSVKWVTTSRARVLTHKVKGYEKGYSGGSRTVSRTLGHDKTVTSGYSIGGGAGAGFSVAKVLVSLDANVEGSYTHQKSKTTTKSVNITDTLTKKGQYFFYRGTVKATGTWQGFYCDKGTKWIEKTWGKAQTFSAQVDGAVRCGEKVNSKSLGRLVQQKYC